MTIMVLKKHDILTMTNTYPRATRVVAAFALAILMGVGASIRVPLPWTPVPVTLQTFVVFAGAAMLTRHYALQMVLWYIGLGALGWPLFAGGAAGWGALVGPTGGYLIGFMGAAGWIGYRQAYVRNHFQQIGVFAIASGILFACGATWLGIVMGLDVQQTFMAGVVPFLPGDVLKIIAATAAVSGCKKLTR